MVDVAVEPLMETATRFEHWSELLESFRNAVVIIDREYPATLKTPAAQKMQKNRVKIENAIELVESQLDRFSNRTDAEYNLSKLINGLPKASEVPESEVLFREITDTDE